MPTPDMIYDLPYGEPPVMTCVPDAVPTAIRARMSEEQITITELARRIGIGRQQMSRYLNEASTWSVPLLAQVADALDLDLTMWFREKSTNKEGDHNVITTVTGRGLREQDSASSGNQISAAYNCAEGDARRSKE